MKQRRGASTRRVVKEEEGGRGEAGSLVNRIHYHAAHHHSAAVRVIFPRNRKYMYSCSPTGILGRRLRRAATQSKSDNVLE